MFQRSTGLCTCANAFPGLGEFSLHKIKIVFISIQRLALIQNGPTKLVIWILGGQSTVPPLRSSLFSTVIVLSIRAVMSNLMKHKIHTKENCSINKTMFTISGFENPTDNSSAQLLIWHEKVFDEADVGSIVRVLTDRKRV